MRSGWEPQSSSTPPPIWMPPQAPNATRIGLAMCAVSVHMEFLPEAGKVESKTTFRTMTYLEGKPECAV